MGATATPPKARPADETGVRLESSLDRHTKHNERTVGDWLDSGKSMCLAA